jgi:hypothetical protein
LSESCEIQQKDVGVILMVHLCLPIELEITTNASTVNLRANAGNSGVSVCIGGLSIGVFTDAVNTYTSATTDAMNYQTVTASIGTSMIGAAPATTYGGQSFRNIPVGLLDFGSMSQDTFA